MLDGIMFKAVVTQRRNFDVYKQIVVSHNIDTELVEV